MQLFWLKLKFSLTAVWRVFTKPAYLVLAAFLAALVLLIILWAFNLDLLGFILFDSGLGVSGKLKAILTIYESLGTNFERGMAVSLVTVSVLLGINLSLLTYVLKQRGKVAKAAGKSAGGLVVAIVGAGCAACGTSILGPVLSLVGAGGSIAAAQTLGLVVNLLSILLILFSIYSLGKVAATLQAS